ncbi:hypothetical protein ACLIX5_004459 [Salmonella enterica subsp. enterica serovar Bredeney]
MKYEKEFNDRFVLDETSPTGLRERKTGAIAGEKQKANGYTGYHWIVRTTVNKKRIRWTLPHVLIELRTGQTLNKFQMVDYLDGNKDNLSAKNLVIVPKTTTKAETTHKVAFASYRNIILSRNNPDYYKDPTDWTDPASLAALAAEQEKRAKGESVATTKLGRPRLWLP